MARGAVTTTRRHIGLLWMVILIIEEIEGGDSTAAAQMLAPNTDGEESREAKTGKTIDRTTRLAGSMSKSKKREQHLYGGEGHRTTRSKNHNR